MQGRLHTREDSGLVLDREGRWFHDGEPVVHPKIAEAFSRGLARAPDGRYLLRFGQDWCFVTVEDAPLQVLAISLNEAAPEGLFLKLSNGTTEPLDPATLSERYGILYCVASDAMPARFSRAAQSALGAHLEEHDGRFALRLGAASHPIRSEAAAAAAATPRGP